MVKVTHSATSEAQENDAVRRLNILRGGHFLTTKVMDIITFLCLKPKQTTGLSMITTARKIGFALFLIRIKDEVKYNKIFDNTFDAHQKCVKYVTPLHIPLTRITTLTLPLTRVKLKSNS